MTSNFRHDPAQGKADNLERLKLKARFRLEIESAGLPQKAVAIGAGIDEGHLSRLLNDSHGDALPAHKLPAITRELGPGLMEWIALQCGGVYVHGTEAQHIEAAPGVLTGMLAHEVGDVVQQVFQDMADGSWSADERMSRVAALRKVVLVAQSLLADAEGAQ
jgi:hypothetical protein